MIAYHRQPSPPLLVVVLGSILFFLGFYLFNSKNSSIFALSKLMDHMRTFHISIGGERGTTLEVLGANSAEEKNTIQDLIKTADATAIREYMDRMYGEGKALFPCFYFSPIHGDGVPVNVSDANGNNIYRDTISATTLNLNQLRNFKNWKYSKTIKIPLAQLVRSGIDFDPDENLYDCSMMADAPYEAQIDEYCVAHKLKYGQKDTVLIHYAENYGVSFECDLEIPNNEDFCIEKLGIFCSDYDGIFTDFCQDCIAPIIVYDGVVYLAYAEDVEDHYSTYGYGEIVCGNRNITITQLLAE